MKKRVFIVALVLFPCLAVAGPGTPRSFFEATADRSLPECERIQKHLKLVETWLRSRDTSMLSPELQRSRQQNLSRLREYWQRGEFPQNLHGEFAPTFIDDDGTACAVGHLIIESGHGAVARTVALTQNHAFVPEIAVPDVSRWIERSGLTPLECAMIQPTYGACPGFTSYGCTEFGNDVVMTWVNGDVYTDIVVLRDFQQIAVLDGTATTCVDSGVPNGSYNYMMVPTCLDGWTPWILPSCFITVDVCVAPTLDCSSTDDDILLTWTLGEPYESVELRRDEITIATLPGDATAFVDAGVPDGDYLYQAVGTCPFGSSGSTTCLFSHVAPVQFRRGDCDNSGGFNLGDAIGLLAYIFIPPASELACHEACDANDDHSIDIVDPVAILTALFVPDSSGATTFECEYDGAGPLSCDSYGSCP